ncbi:hypothetical protein Hanom_Chr12g01066431 [Helianthus anomalus]
MSPLTPPLPGNCCSGCITAGISVKTTTDWETEFSQRGFSVVTIFKILVEIQGFVANKDS